MNKKQKQRGSASMEIQSDAGNTIKEKILILPLVLTIVLVPLAVGTYIHNLDENIWPFWPTTEYIAFYHHHSAILMIIILILMCLLGFFSFKKDLIPSQKSKRLILVGLLVFMAITIVSSIFSDYRNIAIWGAPDRFEGLWVQISYILLAIYTIIFIGDKDYKKTLTYSFLFLASAVSIIGIFNYFDKDLLYMEPVRSFINLFSDPSAPLAERGAGSKWIFPLTFGNSNYSGTYVALIIPLLLSFSLDRKNGKITRILSAFLLIPTFVIMFTGRSQAGMVGVFCSLLLFAVLNARLMHVSKKQTLMAIFISMVAITGIYMSLPDAKKNLIKDIGEDAKLLFTKSVEEETYDPNYGLALYDFVLKDNEVDFYTVSGDFTLKATNDLKIAVFAKDGHELIPQKDEESGMFVLPEPLENINYTTIEQASGAYIGIYVEYVGSNHILMTYSEEYGFLIVDSRGYVYTPEHAPHFGFEGKEKIGSGRGYIWSRSIPILKESLLLGKGPDNFLVAFPQHDYWAKTYVYRDSFMITDKPHNMYLQWAVNNGVLATLALLGAFGIFVAKSSKDLIRYKKEDENRLFKLGILSAMIGYLATGMFNDSITSVAPIFWVLFGLGVSLLAGDQEEVKDNAK